MNSFKNQVDNAISGDNGLPGWTEKLSIGADDIYVKTAFMGDRLVHIDITLSRGAYREHDNLPKSEAMAVLETSNFDLARSWVEDSCRMMSRLFSEGVEPEDALPMWLGISGYPSGPCGQLQCIAKSPLHAAAVFVLGRLPDWKKELNNQT